MTHVVRHAPGASRGRAANHGGPRGVILGLLLSLVLAACGIGEPARPAILVSLVAATPAGSEVTVDHWTPGPLGAAGGERWKWVVKSADARAVLAAYSEWFRDNGIPVTATPDGDISADSGRLTILLGPDDAGDPAVLGTLADDSVLAR